jgi:hypothetical protein
MKKFIIILLIVFGSLNAKEVPGSGQMMFDVFPVRPIGIVSIGIGLSFFIVSVPFSLLSNQPDITIENNARRLVYYPIKFTFQRPIGEFYGYMEEIEYISE